MQDLALLLPQLLEVCYLLNLLSFMILFYLSFSSQEHASYLTNYALLEIFNKKFHYSLHIIGLSYSFSQTRWYFCAEKIACRSET